MGYISRKNQVTLPVEALRAAGLEPGETYASERLALARRLATFHL